MSDAQFTIQVSQGPQRVSVLGPGDRNLKILREALGVHVLAREEIVQVSGEARALAAARWILDRLLVAGQREQHLTRQQVVDLVSHAMSQDSPVSHTSHAEMSHSSHPSSASSERDFSRGFPRETSVGLGAGFAGRAKARAGSTSSSALDPALPATPPWRDHLDVYVDGKAIRAQTPNQQLYLNAIRDHDLVFGVGPAGTGKTYLAVAAAVHLLRAERTRKIILVRPAVEAGERLGFLPGGYQEKVNPYLRPLLDALHDMMDFATIKRFMFNDVVEVIPLAYMRGRTLNHSVIILDEAQNTTRSQMQMFLTRMGHGSKMIVTGDVSQIDLPDPTESGLVDAIRRLRRVPGVGLCAFAQGDIVRHPLVQRIVEAYGPMPVQQQPVEPWSGDSAKLMEEDQPMLDEAEGEDGVKKHEA